jgi:hypothetical protein
MTLKEKFNIVLKTAVAALVVFILYSWLQGVLAGEAGRVRKFILRGKRAFEEKNLLACSEMIAFDYRDKYQNERSTLIYIVRDFFTHYKNILVNIEKMDIQLNDTNDQAEVEIKKDKKWLLAEIEFLEEVPLAAQMVS